MTEIRQILLACVLCVSATGVMALDADDIRELLENGVQDSVIINMVQAGKLPQPLTAREIVDLSRAGASPSLLEYLTSPNAANPPPIAPPVTIVEPAPATTVVTPQPNVVVTQQPTVVYETPTYYYPQSYVYPTPYYYPYRSGPSISFWFGSGGRRHSGPRYGGGHRPPQHGRPHRR